MMDVVCDRCSMPATWPSCRPDVEPFTDLQQLVPLLTDALLPLLLDKPFVFFGHRHDRSIAAVQGQRLTDRLCPWNSLGSLVAYEVAKHLRTTGAPVFPLKMYSRCAEPEGLYMYVRAVIDRGGGGGGC